MHDLIGGRIRKLRKTLKLTQEALAMQLGVSQQHISHIENGTKRASELLIKYLCLLFNTTETWLTKGEGDMIVPHEEIIKTQIMSLGERNFGVALNKLLNEGSLEVLRSFLAVHLEKKPLDPQLEHMIDFLVDLWSMEDDKYKSWAIVQFDRAFPQDIKEQVQRRKED